MADFLIGSVVGVVFVGFLGLTAIPSVVLREVTVVTVEAGQGRDRGRRK